MNAQYHVPDFATTVEFWTNLKNTNQRYYNIMITSQKTLAILSVKLGSDNTKSGNISLDTKERKVKCYYGGLTSVKEISKEDALEIHNHYVKIFREAIYPMEII